MSKSVLRRHFRAVGREICREADSGLSLLASEQKNLNAHLIQWLTANFSKPLSLWGGFQSLPGEPDLSETYSYLEHEGGYLAFPVVSGETLQFFSFFGQTPLWRQSHWGLREPEPMAAKPVAISDVQGFFVPGLAFDRRGGRLGRGKGYYDRALQDFSGVKIGVAFSRQVTGELPIDPHDVRMDSVVTDTEVLDWRESPQGSSGSSLERKNHD